MTERIYIGVAWPYANGFLHLGHIAGAYLPADIFARYHRLKGNDVLMVSGSDSHGTPITVRAEQEGTTPEAVVERYHSQFLKDWQRLGISWDLYTTTGTENHKQVAQEMFTRLLEHDYIYKGIVQLPYCDVDKRYLPDRYVNGTCPYCAFQGARGDQCDNCGRLLDPQDLKEPYCATHKTTPTFVPREHFYLKLSAFQQPLLDWMKDKDYWRQNVVNFSRQFVSRGLNDRSYTRDLTWGVPVPLPGYDDRRIYVWFEAVCGYLSASKEWAKKQGTPDRWEDFWKKDARHYYFIGKDNITFHTVVWPAMLIGSGDNLNLPYDVPANEFLNIESGKFSKSRNWAVWVPDYLERYDPDPLRYVLTAIMPETSDANFTWQEFVRRNNNELVGTYGNLVHRVLNMTATHFEGKMPDPGALDAPSQAIIDHTRAAFDEVGDLIAACHFRQALAACMSLASEVNRYLDSKEPWKTAKTDRAVTARTLYTALAAISGLRTLVAPVLPFTSQQLHTMLGFPGTVEQSGWELTIPAVGQQAQKPKPLFVKLDEEDVVQRETAKLGA